MFAMQTSAVICPRDKVETNISCARCGEPICPRCLVYTPVGNKCGECANIGGPEMFKVATGDIVKGAVLGGIGALVLGAVVGLLVWVLWNLSLFEGLPTTVWLIVVGIINGAGAFAAGNSLRLVVGLKYSNSLRVLAAVLGLVFFIGEVVTVVALGIGPTVLNLPGLVGFAIGAYYAMNRFKVH